MSYVDAREVPDGSELVTDICVIGAGAVGITIAADLVGAGSRVILLESGGQLPDQPTQALYDGQSSGFPYYSLSSVRLRFLGGTTNHWAGVSRPLDAVDFQARDWVPRSGWPIDEQTLEPYYRRAHEICDLGPLDYDPALWEAEDARPLEFDSDALQTVMLRVSPPTRFAQKFAPVLERESNVTTYLHGNAVGVDADDSDGRVRSVEVACLSGTRFRIRAGAFVLATGGIENARFLLHCRETDQLRFEPASEYWVGRCFMEHLNVSGGVFLPADINLPTALYRHRLSSGGHIGFGALTPSPEAMVVNRMLHPRVMLAPTNLREGLRYASPGLVAARVAAQSGRLFEELGEHLANIAAEIDDLAIFSYEQMFRSRATRNAYYLAYQMEQAPDPDSRIELSDDLDALGMRRVRLHWQLGELERHTLRRMNELIAVEAGAAGLGRVWDAPFDDTDWPPGIRGAWHQMGTTRMSADPGDGVVDADGRVHGLENFYLAGGSVFPTGGHANPTLTVVALALRLADHIRELRA